MATNNEIIAILGILSASFPRFSATKETAQVYQMLLGDIPGEELKAAALQCISKYDFFPSVHEIRKEVTTLRKRINGIPSSAEAWQNLLGARGRAKWREAFANEDGSRYIGDVVYIFLPMVEEVGRSLGWPEHFEYEMADRAHFMKEYERKTSEIIEEEITLPEVRKFIESKKQSLLEAQNEQFKF